MYSLGEKQQNARHAPDPAGILQVNRIGSHSETPHPNKFFKLKNPPLQKKVNLFLKIAR
jgi:hypothetical protein